MCPISALPNRNSRPPKRWGWVETFGHDDTCCSSPSKYFIRESSHLVSYFDAHLSELDSSAPAERARILAATWVGPLFITSRASSVRCWTPLTVSKIPPVL